MLRVVQHLVGQAGFHHHATLHDDDAVRQQAGDREIVRDQGLLMLLGNMRAEERLAAFLLNLLSPEFETLHIFRRTTSH